MRSYTCLLRNRVLKGEFRVSGLFVCSVLTVRTQSNELQRFMGQRRENTFSGFTYYKKRSIKILSFRSLIPSRSIIVLLIKECHKNARDIQVQNMIAKAKETYKTYRENEQTEICLFY